MRSILFFLFGIALVSCSSGGEESDVAADDKNCSCHEITALNAVSIDLDSSFRLDNILGDSVLNQMTYHRNGVELKLLVCCQSCDPNSVKCVDVSDMEKEAKEIQGVERSSVRAGKFTGTAYQSGAGERKQFLCSLAAKTTKKWQVALVSRSIDEASLKLVMKALPTLEIKEEKRQ